MRALVTGASGFLGSHLVDALLAQGDTIVAFGRRLRGKALNDEVLMQVECIENDIRDAAAVIKAARGCDVLFHCAALVGIAAYCAEPALTHETEEVGLRNVTEAARRHAAKVIYTSSSAVYGEAGGEWPLEESKATPLSSYAIAKRAGELNLAGQYRDTGLQSVSLRIFNMYGPRQDQRLVIPRFIRAALDGKSIEIYGDGAQTRDFVYVGDVVAAALRCAAAVNGCEIVNVCSGTQTSVLGLANAVCQAAGVPTNIKLLPVPESRRSFEVARSFGTTDRLRRLTGIQPAIRLREGLTRTVAAMRG